MPILTHIISEQGRTAWNGCYHARRSCWRSYLYGVATGIVMLAAVMACLQ